MYKYLLWLIPAFLTLPFIYVAGRVIDLHKPIECARPVILWRISQHDDWTAHDKAAGLIYLFEGN